MSLTFVDPPIVTTVRPNILLYGPEKTGKTAGAASAPGRILYVNADQPNATMIAHRIAGDRLKEVRFEGLSTMADVHNLVYSDTNDFDVVVHDPVSGMYDIILDQLSTPTGSDKPALRYSLPTRGDANTHLWRYIKALIQAPVTTIFVTHDLVIEGDGEADTLIRPHTGTNKPTLGNRIARWVDIVGYTGVAQNEQGDIEYVTQLVPGRGRTAGDRFNVLGAARKTALTEWFDLIYQSGATPDTTSKEQS